MKLLSPPSIVGLFWLIFFLSSTCAQSHHKQRATIGVLVDLHHSNDATRLNNTQDAGRPCGSLNIHAFQQLASVRWAAELINNKSWPGEFGLHIVVHDTCGESSMAQSQTTQLLRWARGNLETPLIGVIVIGSRNNEQIIDKPLENLGKENISAIVTSARAAELLLSTHPNVFTTAPGISSVTEAIIALINQLSSTNVAVISSCYHAIKRFDSYAAAKSIRTRHLVISQKDGPISADAIIKFLRGEAESTQSVILLFETSELEQLVNDDDLIGTEELQQLTREKSWILGTVGAEMDLARDWSEKFQSNLLVMQPHVGGNPEFQSYFLHSVTEALIDQPSDETLQYIEKTQHCHWSSGQMIDRDSPFPPCDNLSTSLLADNFKPDSDVDFIISGVSAYSAALRLAQLKTCKNDTSCDFSMLSTEVIDVLHKFNFPMSTMDAVVPSPGKPSQATPEAIHELEGTRGRINHEGKVISRKYDLFLSKPNRQVSRVGQFSREDGLVLDVMLSTTLDRDLNSQDNVGSARPLGRDRTAMGQSMRQGKTAKGLGRESFDFSRIQVEDSVNVRKMSQPELYISRVWAMAVTAVAITGVFISLYMLVYVLQRMCDGTLNGNQILGILLLLGVMMMYSSVVLFVLPPGNLLCNFRVFFPSLATTLCFGILLLKAMQLRSLVSLGLGGRVSAINQFVTLIFIVAVQIAVTIQWFFSPHPQKTPVVDGLTECFYSHENYLYLHSYVGLLVLIVFLYGTSVLRIRRNYNEAKWITLSAFLSLPIGVAWAVTVHSGPANYQDPAACIAFLAIATVVLFSIFIPKLSTISQQSMLAKRKKMLQQAGPGYTGSISTIFTTLSDRGTLQSQISQKRHGGTQNHVPTHYIPPPPPMPSGSGKSVTYSPRLTTNYFQSSSAATSLARSVSMKTPFFENGRAAYP